MSGSPKPTEESPRAESNSPWLEGVSANEMARIVDALYRVHTFNSAISDLDALLERIMDEGKAVAQAEACSVMLYERATGELYFRLAMGESGDQQALMRQVRLKLGEGIAGSAALTRRPIATADAQQDPRFYRRADAASHFETRTLLAVPLVEKDELVGVLEVVNKRGGAPFTDADVHVMLIFASLVATSIEHARLIEENRRRERMAAVGQAVAGVSHCAKNLVAGMSSSMELIEEGLKQHDLNTLRRSWPVFRRSTKRISNFLEDMLAFAKPRTPQREAFPFEALVEEVHQTYAILLARKKVSIDIDLDGVQGPVSADRQGLYRCLMNLLANAVEAVEENTGQVRITARTTAAGALEVVFADNGCGVPAALGENVFEPFISDKGTQGTGLGLAVTRKIVAEHGGEIVLEQSPLGGAQFRLVVPPNGRFEEEDG